MLAHERVFDHVDNGALDARFEDGSLPPSFVALLAHAGYPPALLHHEPPQPFKNLSRWTRHIETLAPEACPSLATYPVILLLEAQRRHLRPDEVQEVEGSLTVLSGWEEGDARSSNELLRWLRRLAWPGRPLLTKACVWALQTAVPLHTSTTPGHALAQCASQVGTELGEVVVRNALALGLVAWVSSRSE